MLKFKASFYCTMIWKSFTSFVERIGASRGRCVSEIKRCKNFLPAVKCYNTPFPKWRQINYSLVCMLISKGIIYWPPFWNKVYGARKLLFEINNKDYWIKLLLNNYWMRLSMISWIIKAEVCVICRSRRLRQITQTRGFDHSWLYHAKTEFSNCFIIHFSHNSSSETEAKRSAICFWGEHSKGLCNQADVELDMYNN